MINLVVVILQTVPERLRWDVTKWLSQVGIGVYVGDLNATLREHLWSRITDLCKSGEAVMIWSSNTEQGYDFYVHNLRDSIIDFDGLKFLLKPSFEGEQRTFSQTKLQERIRSQFFKRYSKSSLIVADYVVIDIETTGLDIGRDEILEVAALRVRNCEVVETFSALIQISGEIPVMISELTGITQEMMMDAGLLSDVLWEFKDFLRNDLLVGYNIRFDLSFLNKFLVQCDYGKLRNRFVDVLLLMKGLYPDLQSYKLEDVLSFCQTSGIIEKISDVKFHRGLADCEACRLLYRSVYNIMIN